MLYNVIMTIAILILGIITLLVEFVVIFVFVRMIRKIDNDIKRLQSETNDLIKRRTAIINNNLSDMDAVLSELKNGVVVLSTDETRPFGVKYE